MNCVGYKPLSELPRTSNIHPKAGYTDDAADARAALPRGELRPEQRHRQLRGLLPPGLRRRPHPDIQPRGGPQPREEVSANINTVSLPAKLITEVCPNLRWTCRVSRIFVDSSSGVISIKLSRREICSFPVPSHSHQIELTSFGNFPLGIHLLCSSPAQQSAARGFICLFCVT